MNEVFVRMEQVLKHLEALHDTFTDINNFDGDTKADHEIYLYNSNALKAILDDIDFHSRLYSDKNRQMILADFYEYIFLGRGFYSMKDKASKGKFIGAILRFTNLLSCYETMTVSDNLRKAFVSTLEQRVATIVSEENFESLKSFVGKIGLPQSETDATPMLNKYFDSVLPKTAGGLWHELLVYAFLLRNNIGYIIPLLLHQKLIGLEDNLVPPDFLVITGDKDIYGIEVGIKKEIQSGGFSLKTNIPTATIDTINSRVSDRCPICKRWIPFCDYIIEKYSDLENVLPRQNEFRCITNKCDIYDADEVVQGKCQYAKYSRKEAITLEHTKHRYANGYHYHYKCVLDNLPDNMKNIIVDSRDEVAIKTHFPYYAGLDNLIKRGL